MDETIKSLSFENALKQLEEIVHELEQEEVPLEKAINLYQKGMELSKYCDEKLEHAENKMTKILNKENKTEPFNIEGE